MQEGREGAAGCKQMHLAATLLVTRRPDFQLHPMSRYRHIGPTSSNIHARPDDASGSGPALEPIALL
jgi:hypothetical protein